MKLTRNILALMAIIGMSVTLILILDSSHAAGKGKPGGGEDDTNIAFVFEHPDKGLFLTTIDDGNRIQVTRTKKQADHIEPRWSPDGTRIAYLENVDGPNILRVVNADGSGDRAITDAIVLGLPAWTPNGKELVFHQSRRGMMAVEVETGNVRALWEPEIDPDIDTVAISSLGQLAFDSYGDIFVMDYSINADGLIELDPTTIERVTAPETFQTAPSFSPDGTYLAYTYNDYNGINLRIVVQDLLTGDEMVVMEGMNGFRRVTWSPDGSQIATYAHLNGRSSLDLVRITDWDVPAIREFILVTQTDSSRTHEITPDWKPDWTPN